MKTKGIMLGAICAVAIIIVLNMATYITYRENLIDVQEENLLTIARTVANSLDFFYEESTNKFKEVFSAARPESLTGLVDLYYNNIGQETTSVSMVTSGGKILHSQGEVYEEMILDVIQSPSDCLCPPILAGENKFTQFMKTPVQLADGTPGYIIAAIAMEDVYDDIVKPIKVGSHGYSMVKNMDGIILMHNTASQIGLDSIKGRLELYGNTNVDLTDLMKIVEEQRQNEEGKRVFTSYWWDREPLEKTKKIIAYTRITVGDEQWIVNTTLDYDELNRPLAQTTYMFIGISIAILFFFSIFLSIMINNANKVKSQHMELNYMKEINNALEELHKREEQLRHRDKVQTIGTLTGMIAHEFNNYLSPIIIYSDMMEMDGKLDEESLGFVKEIRESATRASELTKDLSLYAYHDKGNSKIVWIPVVQQLKRSLKTIRKMLPSNIRMNQQIEEGDYYIRSSEGAINQMVINLCTNAIYAMKRNGGTLSIEAKRVERKDQKYFHIQIADDGMGMSESIRSQVFQPFFTTKEAGSGTGLGLSVVNDLVTKTNGIIEVKSEEEKGTTFDIYLPLVKKNISEEEPKSVLDLKKRKLNIFLVEDNVSVGKALAKLLTEYHHKVTLFHHPATALEQLKKKPSSCDVILTDYSMPIMNGLEFASILRSVGVDAKIILMIGYLEQDMKWYLDNGIINSVLEKPIEGIQLEEEIEKVLNQ